MCVRMSRSSSTDLWSSFADMGWLWLVGCLKIQVSFAEYSLFYRALLQKRPMVLGSLLIVAISCQTPLFHRDVTQLSRRLNTYCNTLQHATTHGNTLQHTATHYNTLQHTATHCNTLQHTAAHCNTLICITRLFRRRTTYCNTLQHTAVHGNTR